MVDVVRQIGVTGGPALAVLVVAFSVASLVFRMVLDMDLNRYKSKLQTEVEDHKNRLNKELESHKSELQTEIENHKSELNKHLESHKSGLRKDDEREARIRDEALKWANPILGSVRQLRYRLGNILDNEGWVALEPGFTQDDWSMTYEYFMSSTLYAFATYFHWVERLEAAMSFELFETQEEKDRLLGAIAAVSRALGSYPPNFECDGEDAQVFRYQQQAIGEALILRSSGDSTSARCMNHDEFLRALTQGDSLETRLSPLRSLIEEVNPGSGCRWQRLEEVRKHLLELEGVCASLLDVSREEASPSQDGPSN